MAAPIAESSVATLLSKFKFCAGLVPEELEILASRLREVTIPGGKIFIEHDSCTNQVFFLLDGVVEVVIPLVGKKHDMVLAKLGPFETVGEFALIRDARRSATSRALTDLRVLVTENDDLLNVFELYPRMGYVLFRNLSHIIVDRLVDTNMVVRNTASQTF